MLMAEKISPTKN